MAKSPLRGKQVVCVTGYEYPVNIMRRGAADNCRPPARRVRMCGSSPAVDYFAHLRKSSAMPCSRLAASFSSANLLGFGPDLPLTAAAPGRGSKSPNEELQALTVPDGMELGSSLGADDYEPGRAIDIDSHGRVWVAEIQGYRRAAKNGEKIKVLKTPTATAAPTKSRCSPTMLRPDEHLRRRR